MVSSLLFRVISTTTLNLETLNKVGLATVSAPVHNFCKRHKLLRGLPGLCALLCTHLPPLVPPRISSENKVQAAVRLLGL